MSILNKIDELIGLVRNHRDYAKIAEKTGISKIWIAKFATHKIKNPGVNHLSKLENYFLQNLR